jgi:pimeloyl-ACP methyl ester carboxylesterase
MPAAIPGARVIEIADAGHLSVLEQPAAFAAAVGSIRTA